MYVFLFVVKIPESKSAAYLLFFFFFQLLARRRGLPPHFLQRREGTLPYYLMIICGKSFFLCVDNI